MEAFKIIGGSILAAVAYGIAHDQITARVCVEYFTIGHANVFGTESPTLLALGWGIIATWWVGLMLGIPLAIAARFGSRPKLVVRELHRPLGRLLLWMGGTAIVAGVVGYALARSGVIWLEPSLATEISPDRHARFQADAFAHEASYLVGFIGGLVVCRSTWLRRKRLLVAE
ncbi:MAG: hypothetical protein K0Q72_4673 [Armatimonadetes bacterium]|nr:hypothetical protein [Armatimonadota bacterium]